MLSRDSGRLAPRAMTYPAARVDDAHSCPAHVGGSILPEGCPTVVIGGKSAARIGDMCKCEGPTDMIRTGAPTVLIGGLPAARLGDLTRHGGKVTSGFPTVWIGALPGDAVSALFTDEYLQTLIGKDWQGSGSEQLRDAMHTLWEYRHDPNNPAVADALKAVAEARGLPLEQVQKDWQTYQAALAEQERIAAAKGLEAVEGLSADNADFMGTQEQLRFGQLTGDAMGMDPVFGALLSPTGGMVGGGNNAIDGNDSALGYHGAVHDAGGYLYNYHDQGPGYNYLGQEDRDTGHFLTGQQSGISYWREQLPDRGIGWSATDAVADGLAEVGVPIYDAGASVVETVGNAYDTVKETVGNAYNTVTETVGNAYDATTETVGNAYDTATDWASDQWNSLWD